MYVSHEDSPFVRRETRLMRGTEAYVLEEDLKHLCHAQTDLRGNNLCLLWLLLPTSLCQEHVAEDQGGALRDIYRLRHRFFYPLQSTVTLHPAEKGRGVEPAEGTHSWSALQTMQDPMGSWYFHDIRISPEAIIAWNHFIIMLILFKRPPRHFQFVKVAFCAGKKRATAGQWYLV